MSQTSLTDHSESDEEHPSHSLLAPTDPLENIDIDGMELTNNASPFEDFPEPDEIDTLVGEDMNADVSVHPEHVRDAIETFNETDSLGTFLVMDAKQAYEYLETIQKKSDKIFNNFHLEKHLIHSVSGDRGLAKGKSLLTYDKCRINKWEMWRRVAESDRESWNPIMHVLTKDNTGLPNNGDN